MPMFTYIICVFVYVISYVYVYMSQVVFIVVLNHVIACVWFFTGRTAIDTGAANSLFSS